MTVETVTTLNEPTPDASDAAMSAAWDAMEAGDGGTVATETADASEGPARGADGRFTAKQPEATAEQPAPAAEAPPSLEGDKEGAAAPGSTAASGVPSDLPPAVKAAWAKLGPDEVKALTEHKASIDRKFSELGRQIEQVRPIAENLQMALASVPELKGYTPEAMAKGALELAVIQAKLERGSEQDKLQLVAQIAQTYGVLPQLQAALTGQPMDPNTAGLAGLQQEIASLKQQLAQAQQQPDIDTHISQVMERRDLEVKVQAFANDKPLYSVVEHLIPSFIAEAKAANPAISFDDALGYAYTKAIDSQPALRQLLENAQGATTATPQPADTERAAAAKKAAAINVKPAVNGKPRVLSEDEILSAEWDKLQAAS